MRKLAGVFGVLFGLLCVFVAWRGYADLQALSRHGASERRAVLDRRIDKDAFGTQTPRFQVSVEDRLRWLEARGPAAEVGDEAWVRYLPGQPTLVELYADEPPASPWRQSRFARQFWMAALAGPLFVLCGLSLALGYGPRGARDALRRFADQTHHRFHYKSRDPIGSPDDEDSAIVQHRVRPDLTDDR